MKRIVVLMSVAALSLAACGSDDDSSAATTTPADTEPVATDTPAATDAPVGTTDAPEPTEAADTTEPEAAYPVTIDHRFGSTTFEAAPEHIVSLDPQWTDVLLALNAPLDGYVALPFLDTGYFPWQEGLLDGVEPIPAIDTIPYEVVAALHPDLIVITYFAVDQATYDQLSQIAPTIATLSDAEVDQWQDMAVAAGQILDQPDEAQALIDDSEQLSADVLAELPGLEGKTYALANYVAGDAIYIVADPNDGAATFFRSIGLEIDPELVAAAGGASGRMQISTEEIGMLDSDLLILLTNGADPNEIPGYAALPAVQSGAVSILDAATVSGLNTPSPLSIPYALDAIRPALEAAAAS